MTPPHLLLVDDDADLRFVLRTALEAGGAFEVVAEAADGVEAVELAELHKPDLIVLDVEMPRLSGLSALPQISVASPASKVVILSGAPRHTVEPRAMESGAVGYLEKGILGRRLIDELLSVAGLIETAGDALAAAGRPLSGGSESAAPARTFTDEVLRRWNCGSQLDVVRLLVTELVANASGHAGGAVEVHARLLPDAIRVEVLDASPDLPKPRDAEDDEESGRGMLLIQTLAQDWGVDATHGGKRVWFEVARWDEWASTRIG